LEVQYMYCKCNTSGNAIHEGMQYKYWECPHVLPSCIALMFSAIHQGMYWECNTCIGSAIRVLGVQYAHCPQAVWVCYSCVYGCAILVYLGVLLFCLKQFPLRMLLPRNLPYPDTHMSQYRHSHVSVQTLTCLSTDTHMSQYRHSHVSVQTLTCLSTNSNETKISL